MNTDERIAAARRQLAEAEASLQVSMQTLASARGCLTVVEEENRQLRREALEQRNEYYTEKELSELLKISESTVARLRRAGRLRYLRIGGQVRYSAAMLALDQTFEAGCEKRTRPRRIA